MHAIDVRRIDLQRGEQHRTDVTMKRIAVAETDGAYRVAVICVGQGEKRPSARMTAELPILRRHPYRDFDGLGARIGIENAAEARRGNRYKFAAQFDRGAV